MVSLATLLTFWKKKESQAPPERIIPLPNLPGSTLERPRSSSLEDVKQAKEALKVLKLERQIIGSAVTTIYESQMKGTITEAERDRLLEKYKVDLERIEKSLDEKEQVVELYDLDIEREQVTKNYRAKLAEIDARLKELRSGSTSEPRNPIPYTREQTNIEAQKSVIREQGPEREAVQDQSTKQKEDEQITNAEKRIEKIRAEILQAMDRLEQIEAEG